MQDQLNAVAAFHQAFNVGVSQNPTTNVTNEIALLRHRLMAEENNEYLEAVENKDIVEVADALGDMLYILCGTILTLMECSILLKPFLPRFKKAI